MPPENMDESIPNGELSEEWTIFALTAVAYRTDSLLSMVLAVSSLCPLVILIMLGTLILSRRDLHTISLLTGQLLNECVNQLLKRWAKQPRPAINDMPAIHYGKYGWPSNHSQFISFFVVYLALFIMFRLRVCSTSSTNASNGNSRGCCHLYKAMLLTLLLAMAAVVCVGRVHLGHHSCEQVVWGCVFGACCGALWFAVVQSALTPCFPAISQWPICEWLLIRDCTAIPNVLFFEYSCTRSEARSRQRKSYRAFKHD
jgi:dolichyldiphosphatase